MPAAPHHPADASSPASSPFPPGGPVATPEDLRDLQLVKTAKAGGPDSAQAWRDLLSHYQDRLYGVCLRVLGDSPRSRQIASDLTQDAMVKIIQGLGSFDGSAKVSTWMIRVTMNVCLSHLRSQKLRNHASLDTQTGGQTPNKAAASSEKGVSLADLLGSREQTPLARVSHQESRAIVAAALATIDPEQRAILVLRDAKGLEYHQIAQVLGVPVGTIKSRLFRARLALRQACEQSGRPSTGHPRPRSDREPRPFPS